MNKKFLSAVLLATLLGMASVPASAQDVQSGGYIGVNYAFLDTKIGPAEFTTPALILTPGYQVNSFFAIEGRFGSGFSIGDDDVEVKKYLGIFARLGAPVNPRFYPYLMLGYGDAKFELSINSPSVEGSDTSRAYGIGANIGFTDKLFGKVEYMNYYAEDSEKTSGFGIGLQFNF